MNTYVIKTVHEFDGLTADDLTPFVDGCGRLDVRIEGEAATRPFAVLNVLRGAGFIRAHTWVETETEPGDQRPTVALHVTATLLETPAVVNATETLEVREPVRLRALARC